VLQLVGRHQIQFHQNPNPQIWWIVVGIFLGILVSISCNNNGVFQGHITMMTLQCKDKVAPFVTRIHYFAHNTNLVVITLLGIPFGALVGAFPTKLLCFFVSNLKKFIKFQKLADIFQTKVNKLLRNVETCWISMLF
jgi:hypothetical protein